MRVVRGRSFSSDAAVAVAEATRTFDAAPPPDMVFAFASSHQPAEAVARHLRERFPDAPIVGCTTAGEQLDGEFTTGALVVTGLADSRVRWATAVMDDLARVDSAAARHATQSLFDALQVDRENFDPHQYFCILLVDGLSGKEEILTALVSDALEGIPLIGASAGDDLAFRQTHVFHGGSALSNAAVLVLGHSQRAFSLLKHQHYSPTPAKLVVTRADVARRTVYEFDGYPAVEAYARALGLEPSAVSNDVIIRNPVTFSYAGEVYIRSVQRVDPDGALVFYCSVEEGMVLEIASKQNMRDALARSLDEFVHRSGRAEFMLTFNCILRALESRGSGPDGELSSLFRDASASSLGFDTYGEQLNGLHINQTLVALAFQHAAE